MRVLLVCLGNICRSPMAEGLLRQRLDVAGLGHVEVDSAGLGDWHAGDPPDPRAIACAAGHGVDIAAQRARALHAADFAEFDWILCADVAVLARAEARRPRDARAEVARLLDWAGQPPGDVPDPYTGGRREFAQVWAQLEAAMPGVLARLAAGT
jgi:protein-tyrosine phosphatase